MLPGGCAPLPMLSPANASCGCAPLPMLSPANASCGCALLPTLSPANVLCCHHFACISSSSTYASRWLWLLRMLSPANTSCGYALLPTLSGGCVLAQSHQPTLPVAMLLCQRFQCFQVAVCQRRHTKQNIRTMFVFPKKKRKGAKRVGIGNGNRACPNTQGD